MVINGPKEHSRGRSGGFVADTSKGFLFLFLGIAPCTVRVPKIINIMTKQSFASIAFFFTEKEKRKIQKYCLMKSVSTFHGNWDVRKWGPALFLIPYKPPVIIRFYAARVFCIINGNTCLGPVHTKPGHKQS